jgi:hypothetical protein
MSDGDRSEVAGADILRTYDLGATSVLLNRPPRTV